MLCRDNGMACADIRSLYSSFWGYCKTPDKKEVSFFVTGNQGIKTAPITRIGVSKKID